MKILVLDNYDSFTYNLVQMVEQAARSRVDVLRNDEIALEDIEQYDKIILSPGPGLPRDAGILMEAVREYAGRKSILGVCLGHQAIAEVFGGSLVHLPEVFHGVSSEAEIISSEALLFRGLPPKISVGRYHSWSVDADNFTEALEITAVDEQGRIMALQHREYDVHGVQFHPESVLTPLGKSILANFLTLKP